MHVGKFISYKHKGMCRMKRAGYEQHNCFGQCLIILTCCSMAMICGGGPPTTGKCVYDSG